MTVSAMQAAKYLCAKSGWALTQLELHKILYIAHMVYIGRHNKPLLNDYFEAWKYGPVVPRLYSELKMFGAESIWNIFGGVDEIENQTITKFLDETADSLFPLPASRLVAITHRPGGAWEKAFKKGANTIISYEDIVAECGLVKEQKHQKESTHKAE